MPGHWRITEQKRQFCSHGVVCPPPSRRGTEHFAMAPATLVQGWPTRVALYGEEEGLVLPVAAAQQMQHPRQTPRDCNSS